MEGGDRSASGGTRKNPRPAGATAGTGPTRPKEGGRLGVRNLAAAPPPLLRKEETNTASNPVAAAAETPQVRVMVRSTDPPDGKIPFSSTVNMTPMLSHRRRSGRLMADRRITRGIAFLECWVGFCERLKGQGRQTPSGRSAGRTLSLLSPPSPCVYVLIVISSMPCEPACIGKELWRGRN